MTDAECTEPEPEDVPSDELVAIAVDATDLRPAALRGIAEMLESDAENRAALAQEFREDADRRERAAAQEQSVLDALFALPAGEWIDRAELAEHLAVQEWDIVCVIDALVMRRWPVHHRCLDGRTYEYRLATPSARARLVGGAPNGRD
jgi:hypothetical protein